MEEERHVVYIKVMPIVEFKKKLGLEGKIVDIVFSPIYGLGTNFQEIKEVEIHEIMLSEKRIKNGQEEKWQKENK